MIMGKNNKKFEKLITAFVDETFTDKGGDIAKLRSDITKLIFTPKLQWKSEENTCYGGTVLLSRIHSVVNCDIDIQIYDPGDISPYVTWNGKHVFEGTLEECKQFCSDKILNDFLKLCE